jgi:hypothetical protein
MFNLKEKPPVSGRLLSRRKVLTLAGLTAASTAWGDDASDEIVRQSDTARGGGLSGIIWYVHLVTTGNNDATDGDRDMLVKANSTASVAETLTPVRFRGTRLLQVGRNMWLSRPGLQKPVPISPRQRLSGLASNGDIAATNYAADYSATYLREEAVNGEPCYVLDLVARSHFSTYDRILYWVSRNRRIAVKAQFNAVSGKPLKSATFDYGNTIVVNNQRRPFVSRMIITDALTPAQTVMNYSQVLVQALPASTFDAGNLL